MSPPPDLPIPPLRAWRILLRGAVQGVGGRPKIARLAAERGWCGVVRNAPEGVEVVLGTQPGLDPAEAAEAMRLLFGPGVAFAVTPIDCEISDGFVIEPSDQQGPSAAVVPRDTATCAACSAEVGDATDRRYSYPFTACAECGPRFSVVKAMPYDRLRTTLDAFALCDACRREYDEPRNRRFHAEAIACPRCGPQLWCTDRTGRLLGNSHDAIGAAVAALREGRVVALRGIGGYQLLCDATSSGAVADLRQRKRRPFKPLAVLCLSVETARRLAFLTTAEQAALTAPANPIVLLQRKPDSRLADEVCPGVETVGILLPTTPLHRQLVERADRPLVCTSGNRDGDPLEVDPQRAAQRLAGIADVFLHHDRDIAHPIDDSVLRVIAERPTTFRCARGLAPLPLPLSETLPMIATGGHLKSAVALSNGVQAVLGPHMGDLESLAGRTRWTERLDALVRLYGLVEPQVAWDAHPEYFPSRWATERNLPGLPVWHHHAHIAAGMLEHGLLDRTVLGVAFDGSGLGPDGTIWGGEFLLVAGSRFRRIATLRPFALPGGDAAVGDVRRLATSLLAECPDVPDDTVTALLRLSRQERTHWRRLIESPRTLRTSSCGRLFDAVAAVVLGFGETAFEGQAAMALEAVVDDAAGGEYRFHIGGDEPWQLDWRPVLRAVLQDVTAGETAGVIAARFHRALAAAIVEVCRRRPEFPVVLSGGVFQNRRLIEEIVARWPQNLPLPVWPQAIPPNDGGLAAGQLAILSLARQGAGLAART